MDAGHRRDGRDRRPRRPRGRAPRRPRGAQRLLVRDAARGARPAPRRGRDVRAATTTPSGLRAALDGIDTLLLVSAAEDPDRVALHRARRRRRRRRRGARIVYTSFLGAAARLHVHVRARPLPHRGAHQGHRGRPHVPARQPLRRLHAAPVRGGRGHPRAGRGRAGRGRRARRHRRRRRRSAHRRGPREPDLRPHRPGGVHPRRGGGGDLPRERAAHTFENETVEAAYASRRPSGAADFEIDGWVSTYTAIAAGELETVSDCVERFLDRPPIGLADWLRANPESFRHLAHTE